MERLTDAKKYWPEGGNPIPTTAMDSSWFNAQNYWLGPVWVNTNWMTLRGLQHLGRGDLAETIRETTLKLVQNQGYREYYDPFTGDGYGTDSFGWTAALTIDLVESAGKIKK